MWIRTVRTAPEATAVQIVESVGGRRRIVRHVGFARDEIALGWTQPASPFAESLVRQCGLDVGDLLHEAQAAGDAREPERLVELRDGPGELVDTSSRTATVWVSATTRSRASATRIAPRPAGTLLP